jgi:hypothetical protein
MRLWSLHPQYLDGKGLVALWREGLLARKVLKGETKGYKHHPQLLRFRKQADPVIYVDTYLYHVYLEANKRGYSFKQDKLGGKFTDKLIPVTEGQLMFELEHLKQKLLLRDKKTYTKIKDLIMPKPHPLFYTVEGKLELWEKSKSHNKPES